MTKYLKRIRKKYSFRYMYVIEPHKSGYAHMHMLLFETQGNIPKRHLKDQWKLGFTRWRLCANAAHAAAYCAKYLSKTEHKLVASLRFGQKEFVTAANCTVPDGEGSATEALNDDKRS